MNNTMSSTQKGQAVRATHRRRMEPRRDPHWIDLNAFRCHQKLKAIIEMWMWKQKKDGAYLYNSEY